MINSSKQKRIAINTMMLYARMLVSMLVALFTSRVILATLGVQDYGIYNVVGGFVTMFGFFNNAMSGSTQRFLNFAMGRKDFAALTKIFSLSFTINSILALAVFVLASTVGTWFIFEKIVVPTDRFDAALWTYYLSLLSFCVGMVFTPCSSLIIAHEKMSFYAYLSILDVIFKLLIVYLIQIVNYDKLILYALFYFMVSATIVLINILFCKKNFTECRFSFIWDKNLFNQMFSFSGWLFLGTLSLTLYSQGVNMLINVFFGPLLNAARTIAYQVQAAVSSLVSNFMIAVNPQLVQSYSAGDLSGAYNLTFKVSKMGFYLLLVFTVPVILMTDRMLYLWLGQIPDMSSLFVKLTLIELLISVLFTPLSQLNQASGKIKVYQLVCSLLSIFVFVFTYLFYKVGFPVFSTFLISIVVSFVGLFIRLHILFKIMYFPVHRYCIEVILPLLFTSFSSFVLSYLVVENLLAYDTIFGFMVSVAILIGLNSLVILLCGLTASERSHLYVYVHSKLIRNR